MRSASPPGPRPTDDTNAQRGTASNTEERTGRGKKKGAVRCVMVVERWASCGEGVSSIQIPGRRSSSSVRARWLVLATHLPTVTSPPRLLVLLSLLSLLLPRPARLCSDGGLQAASLRVPARQGAHRWSVGRQLAGDQPGRDSHPLGRAGQKVGEARGRIRSVRSANKVMQVMGMGRQSVGGRGRLGRAEGSPRGGTFALAS